MKGLSIKQPWSYLLANGIKTVENRSWNTGFRGQIFIHAGKSVDKEGYVVAKQICDKLGIHLPNYIEMPTGGIVGVMTIVDVVDKRPRDPFFFGPKGFVVEDARPVDFVPLQGKLSLFETGYKLTPKGRIRPIKS